MNSLRTTTTKIFMSPKELRELADKMDARWKRIRPGESTYVAIIDMTDDGLVRTELHLDQAYYHELDRVKATQCTP